MGPRLLEMTGGQGLDAVVVAVPSDEAVASAQKLVRPGGKILLFAHTRRGAESTIDLASICVDEKDLLGSYSSDVRIQGEVARLVFSRRLDTRKLITHRFSLENGAEAVQLAAQPQPDSLKVIVENSLE